MHYRDGRIVERWNQLDQLAMLQQLGVLPAPAQA
jgi:predicted ester cyclase